MRGVNHEKTIFRQNYHSVHTRVDHGDAVAGTNSGFRNSRQVCVRTLRRLRQGRGSGEKDLQATIGFPAGVKPYAEQWQTPGYRLDALAAAKAVLHARTRNGGQLPLYSTMDRQLINAFYAAARKGGELARLEYHEGLPPLQPERPKREVINAALEAYADKTVRAMVEKMIAEACK